MPKHYIKIWMTQVSRLPRSLTIDNICLSSWAGQICYVQGSESMYCRAIRGATTVERNESEEILAATKELLHLMVERNHLSIEDIASAIFTVTEDLDAAFPAAAARAIGWTEVPLLDAREISVPNSLGKCIRIMLHVNTMRSAAEIRHVYIRGAVNLRAS